MAVEVLQTKHIQAAILEAIRRNSVPQDLEKQLSKYTKYCKETKELDKREEKVAIPFKLVKQLWECLRENTGRPHLRHKQSFLSLCPGID